MADNLNEIINQLDKRLRFLESRPMNGTVISRLVPAGGGIGDYLAKATATDYDFEWRTGYLYSTTLYYTSNGTFIPANYPDLKAVRVRLVGGGGGGGGCASTIAGQSASGGAGGGAGYSEEFIIMNSSTANVTVTVGAGGNGGSAGNNNGVDGGTSSFGAYLSATGGLAGAGDSASAAPVYGGVAGGAGSGSGGNINLSGTSGNRGFSIASSGTSMVVIRGGGSVFSRQSSYSSVGSGAGANGTVGDDYGQGGSGGYNAGASATNRSGGAGSSGIVIVDVFV